jgi:hypothetical protein
MSMTFIIEVVRISHRLWPQFSTAAKLTARYYQFQFACDMRIEMGTMKSLPRYIRPLVAIIGVRFIHRACMLVEFPGDMYFFLFLAHTFVSLGM